MGPVGGQASYRSFSDGLSETTLVSSLHGALGYVGYRMNKNLCGRTLTLGKSAEQGLGKDQSCLQSQGFSWTGFSKPLEAQGSCWANASTTNQSVLKPGSVAGPLYERPWSLGPQDQDT